MLAYRYTEKTAQFRKALLLPRKKESILQGSLFSTKIQRVDMLFLFSGTFKSFFSHLPYFHTPIPISFHYTVLAFKMSKSLIIFLSFLAFTRNSLNENAFSEYILFYLLGLHPVVPIPNSCMFETPMIMAPASRSFFVTVASSVSGFVPKYTVPLRW